ncbi:hypothetical protein K4K58_003341 [Colletotrichum sp. SAR11_239]|nr:hypothetical protein K4K58_003341 [Colletotrichum sp. SAR11_239]
MMGLRARLLEKHGATAALHSGYGRTLRQSLAPIHPFSTLTEVFTLVASSENEFLNMTELKLERVVHDKSERLHKDGLEDLRYFSGLLHRQVRRIKSMLTALESTGHHRKWIRAEDETTDRARREVVEDLEHLHEHAEALCQRCQEEITVLMNTMAIIESLKSIAQAQRMAKLTLLAFFFVPTTFVCSFYSMNVTELQDLPLWSWFVVSMLTLAASIGLYWFDLVAWNNFRAYVERLMQRIG